MITFRAVVTRQDATVFYRDQTAREVLTTLPRGTQLDLGETYPGRSGGSWVEAATSEGLFGYIPGGTNIQDVKGSRQISSTPSVGDRTDVIQSMTPQVGVDEKGRLISKFLIWRLRRASWDEVKKRASAVSRRRGQALIETTIRIVLNRLASDRFGIRHGSRGHPDVSLAVDLVRTLEVLDERWFETSAAKQSVPELVSRLPNAYGNWARDIATPLAKIRDSRVIRALAKKELGPEDCSATEDQPRLVTELRTLVEQGGSVPVPVLRRWFPKDDDFVSVLIQACCASESDESLYKLLEDLAKADLQWFKSPPAKNMVPRLIRAYWTPNKIAFFYQSKVLTILGRIEPAAVEPLAGNYITEHGLSLSLETMSALFANDCYHGIDQILIALKQIVGTKFAVSEMHCDSDGMPCGGYENEHGKKVIEWASGVLEPVLHRHFDAWSVGVLKALAGLPECVTISMECWENHAGGYHNKRVWRELEWDCTVLRGAAQSKLRSMGVQV